MNNTEHIKHKLDNGIPLTSKEAKELLDIIERLERGAPTVEMIVAEIVSDYFSTAPSYRGKNAMKILITEKLTSLTSQHQREKEDIFKEVFKSVAKRSVEETIATMNNSERIIQFADIIEDIEEIATNHNIHE